MFITILESKNKIKNVKRFNYHGLGRREVVTTCQDFGFSSVLLFINSRLMEPT